MNNYTKEERTYVKKNVYAFKISNNNKEFLIFYWHDYCRMVFNTGSDLAILYSKIIDSDFITQYYKAKELAKEKNLLFEEFGKNDWKSILSTAYEAL